MKIINNSILSILSITALLLLFSCGGGHTEGDGHNHGDENTGHTEGEEEHVEGEIHLTPEQIKTMNIQFGGVSQIKINDFVSATGTLGLPPNALTSVTAKSRGFIKNSKKYVEGSHVKSGEVMAYLENPDFIQQQREYLETAAELTYLRQELGRQQKLVEASAGVEKNLQKLESEVNMKTATLKGIAKQLAYLGISVSNLSPDNIVERIAIISPATGYVSAINMHNGMFVEPNVVLAELVSDEHLHLELDVFERDIANVKEGQRISYTVPALGTTVYEGEVYVIGKEFNAENKTVRIQGHLNNVRPKFINGLFIEAKIWLNNLTVQAVPEKAIIKDGNESYIFITNAQTEGEEVKFEKLRVVPGVTDKGFTSVKLVDPVPDGMKIVTEGAFFVYAQSKAGELEHEH
jgi:membrane fusion protein, heavy metal efflux system